MIAESLSEGLLDPEEHNRLSRALQIRTRVVADVAIPLSEVHAVPAAAEGAGPTVRAIQQALDDSGYSRFPVTDTDGQFIGYVHIKDVLRLVNDTDAVVDLSMVRPLPKVSAVGCRCPTPCRGCDAATVTSRWSPPTTAASPRWWHWKTLSRTSSAPCGIGPTVADARARRGRLDRE